VVLFFSADLVHCNEVWTAGQRVDVTRLTLFVWKLITANGYREMPMNYTNWYHGEPNNLEGREACLHVSRGRQWQWNDTPCSKKFCYICEYNDDIQ